MNNTLKATNRTEDELTVSNYIILFGGRDVTGANVRGYATGKKNIDGTQGEYFTKSTGIDSAYTQIGKFPVDWEHGLEEASGEPGREALGYVNWKSAKMDDKGWFVERVLNRRNAYIYALDEAGMFDAGLIGTSSEADPHKATVTTDGEIVDWPLIKDTLTVQPFDPRMLNENAIKAYKSVMSEFPNFIKEQQPEAEKENGGDAGNNNEVHTKKADKESATENNNMDEQEKQETPQVDVAAIAAKAAQEAVKAFQEELAKPSNEKPDNDPGFAEKAKSTQINQGLTSDIKKYDHYGIADLGYAHDIVKGANQRTDPAVIKAMAMRLESSEVNEDKPLFNTGMSSYKAAAAAMKAKGIKANETNFTTNASYGDEWIGVAYSGSLWEEVRVNTFVMDKLAGAGSTFEFPAGAESLVIPLESTDPVWYKVAQAGDPSSATAQVTNTVPAKALGTANTTMTLAKMGSSTIYTGEMVEDAVLPFVNQLRTQIAVSGAEYLESAVLDGDTDTSATTNINDIGGTPAATDWFLLFDGMRKSGLITTTANSRDAGALTANDFLETIKLLGAAGYKGMDNQAVSFILDPLTLYKATELPEIKTRDVFSGATIENGLLRMIYGYMVDMSFQMNKASANRLSNSSGLIDQDTTTNNTKGQILAVRWPSWRFGFRRRMTTEVERIPRADAWEITTLMRGGLQQRDTEAAAISYNVTV